VKKVNRSELVHYIQSHTEEIEKCTVAEKQYPDSELTLITVPHWLDLDSSQLSITIDCRSEAEYEEAHLPGAVNFPILNNKERDEVGFLYKHFSPNAALFHANKIADSKRDAIDQFVTTLSEYDRVYVYCWRGGSRSAAFTHFLQERHVPVEKIFKGYKAFRRVVHSALYENPEQFQFVILSGLTGCGKTEILEKVNDRMPVFDIEQAALHASSLFGTVRFHDQADRITSQQHFEIRLFMQLQEAQRRFPDVPILTESESRKISRFELPIPLFDHLKSSEVVNIDTPLDDRAKRTTTEYFYDRGVAVRKIVESSPFFKKKLGAVKINELLLLIDNGKYEEFCHWFLQNYFDKNYKPLYCNIIATVGNESVEHQIEEIISICNKL